MSLWYKTCALPLPHLSPAAHFNRIFVIRILSGKSGSVEQLDVLSGSRGADLFYDKLLGRAQKLDIIRIRKLFSLYIISDIWCSDYGGRIQIRREHSLLYLPCRGFDACGTYCTCKSGNMKEYLWYLSLFTFSQFCHDIHTLSAVFSQNSKHNPIHTTFNNNYAYYHITIVKHQYSPRLITNIQKLTQSQYSAEFAQSYCTDDLN